MMGKFTVQCSFEIDINNPPRFQTFEKTPVRIYFVYIEDRLGLHNTRVGYDDVDLAEGGDRLFEA